MCGIVGVVDFSKKAINKDKIIRMNDLLTHRGPDFGDVFIDENIALGHRRLSIIDLSNKANQPFFSQDKRYSLVYNGEVYNYLELKKELEQLGFAFCTNSDTEVILTAFIHWGEECFHKFNGMWALGIYDTKTKELLLCRDRFGVKPLYFYADEEKFLFASEKKAIVLSDFVELEFDKKGIKTAIKNPFILEASGYTEFKNTYNLLPGCMLKLKNNKYEIKKWYSLKDYLDKEIPKSFEQRSKKLHKLFKSSCELRLRSDVPIATSLSGGLDSSSVVAMISHIDTAKHKTFAHAYDEAFLDEEKYAQIVAKTTQTPIEVVKKDKEDVKNSIDHIFYHFESIYLGMPDSPYRIYKTQNAQGYKISIDGHGADEMLAGYSRYLDAYQNDHPFNYFKQKDINKHKNEMSNNEQFKQKFDYLKNILAYLKIRFNVFKSEFFKTKPTQSDTYSYKRDMPKNWSNLKRCLYVDFNYTMLPRIIKNFDAMSMANSIEVRMPFLDHRVVEYIFALPDDDLIKNRYTKYILRHSMDGILDKKVCWRKDKIGFNSPVSQMLSSELKEWVLDTIEKVDTKEFDMNKEELKKEYHDKILGKNNWNEALRFWAKINILSLAKIYKERKHA